MGGLGYGSSCLSSTVASMSSVCDSRYELGSLAHLGLAKSLKKLHRCFSSLQKFSDLSSPSPAPGSPHITSWTGLTSTLT